MALLVKYRLDDGGIVGVWEANPVTHLDAQIDVDDSVYGYFFADTALPAMAVLGGYYVAASALQPKRQLTLTAVPAPFVGDGDSRCQVTVSPFVPCTVLVDGIPYELTEEDQTVMLRSEEPHTFTIALRPMAQATADQLTVEAR